MLERKSSMYIASWGQYRTVCKLCVNVCMRSVSPNEQTSIHWGSRLPLLGMTNLTQRGCRDHLTIWRDFRNKFVGFQSHPSRVLPPVHSAKASFRKRWKTFRQMRFACRWQSSGNSVSDGTFWSWFHNRFAAKQGAFHIKAGSASSTCWLRG